MPNIHNYEGQLKKAETKFFGQQSVLHKKDKQDLQRFYTQLMADGKSASRILKVLYTLKTFSGVLNKPFIDACKDDIVKSIAHFENKEDWSDWTKRDTKIIVRMFYKFLRGTEQYPEEVSWIKARDSNKRLLPDDVLTEKEVKKLAENTTNIRDKAFILGIYESGCRIGEFLSLKIKNINFDEYGTVIRATGKTGDRRIRIIASTPALKDWIDKHPHKNNPEAYLWIREDATNPYKHIVYELILKQLHKNAKRAGITKKVNPHAFRHARATFYANKFTDRQMKEFFGWKNTKTIDTYAHLSGRDLDEAVLKQQGIIPNNNSLPVISLKPCQRCAELNDPASKLCKKCYQPMQIDERQQQLNELIFDLLIKMADRHPDTKEMAIELIKQKGLEEIFR